MRASLPLSAVIAVIVGFGGSVAVVLEAARALGASPAESASWVAALCVALMISSAVLSVRYRMPIVTAWSTPGAAVIAATSGIALEPAVGAFVFSAVLVVLTAAIRPLTGLVMRIPAAVASAMLAGVLVQFVLAVFRQAEAAPWLVLPLIALFALVRLWSPAFAVIAVLGIGALWAAMLGAVDPLPGLTLTRPVAIAPEFDPAVMIGLGLPLYLVTMTGQNLPGLAVLRAAGYTPPTRPILAVTGLASLLTAPFGAHASNLAAITAALCTGPEAHPDPARRWMTGPFYAAGYGLLALCAGSVVLVFAAFPQSLIAAVAGLALLSPLVGALGAAMAEPQGRLAATATFVVTASGVSGLGLGAAFWGLVAGLAIVGLDALKHRRAIGRAAA